MMYQNDKLNQEPTQNCGVCSTHNKQYLAVLLRLSTSLSQYQMQIKKYYQRHNLEFRLLFTLHSCREYHVQTPDICAERQQQIWSICGRILQHARTIDKTIYEGNERNCIN